MLGWNGMVKDLQGAFFSIQEEERMVKRIRELTSRELVDLSKLKTEFGERPALHVACHTGNPVAVRVLLKKFDTGSDILKKAGDNEDTAFHWAAASGSTAVLQILLDEHRQMVKNNLVDLTQFQSPTGSKFKVLEVGNLYNRTPLHSAMENGRVEAARFLLRYEANVHAVDKNGFKTIHFAAKSGSVEALELVKEVTSPNVEVNATSRFNFTPLHWAAANGKVATVDWLLRNGADLTVADGIEMGLPLHSAAKGLHIDVVEKLLKKQGTNPFVICRGGKTVLDLVCKRDASSAKLELQKLLQKMQDLKGIFLSEHMVEYVARYGSRETNKWLEGRLTARYVRNSAAKDLVKKVKLLDFAAESDNVDAVQHLLHLIRTLLEGKNKTDHQEGDFLDQLSSALQTALLRGNLKFARALAFELRDTEKVDLGTWVKNTQNEFLGKISQQLRELWEDLLQSQQVDTHSGKLWGRGKSQTYQFQEDELGRQLPFAFILTWMRTMPAKKSMVEATAEFIEQENLWGQIGFLTETTSKSKRNALHWAVLLAKPHVVDELLKIKGCETEAVAQDDNERTPHELAVTAHALFTLAAEAKDSQEKLAAMAKKLERIKIKLQVESQTVKDLNDVFHRDRTLSVEALNAILVGSALLAGITFQGVLQQPTPTNDRTGLNIFAAFNSLSFFFGIASAIIGATGVLPKRQEYIGHLLNDIRSKLTLAAVLLIISIACVLVAFASASFGTIRPSFRYAVLTTTGIGGALCVYALALFMRRIYVLWWFTELEKDSAMHKLLAHNPFARSAAAHETKGWGIC